MNPETEGIKEFEQKWKEKIREIKQSEFSSSQCRNIEEQFIQDIRRITTRPDSNFKEMSEALDKSSSLKSDLILALEQAKSNYRKNKESPLEKIKIKIEEVQLKIFNIF